MFNNIPAEMRPYRQWIIWRYEEGGKKPTKMPYCPNNWSRLASVTDPTTWATFEEAIEAARVGNFDGIGFVLTKGDPFAFIDLDDTQQEQDEGKRKDAVARQLRVFEQFDSYSEVSPSKRGLHIICKGELPCGRRRAHIEVYTSERYMTMTGNVFKNAPIAERQELLSQLWQEMGGAKALTHEGDEPQRESDDDIIGRARAAINGDKFANLFKGDWVNYYGSQSEADFALIDIIAWYTQNRAQIHRLFLASQLGKREKAKRRDYVNHMIGRSFDKLMPPVDMDGLNNQMELALAKGNVTVSAPITQLSLPNLLADVKPDFLKNHPPGLVGELAEFFYQAAPRPVQEIALAAAIGLMSGVAGRAYNIDGAGLNQYILLLSLTGTGKEGMQSGISKIMGAIKEHVPASSGFIGPAIINSGQALIKRIADQPCCVSIVGEFGNHLKQMSAFNANSSQIMLKTMLLDLYHKSGIGNVFGQSVYSDGAKNTQIIEAPAFSILGECNPTSFFDQLNEGMISDGLLPRFTVIEYKGQRVALSKTHSQARPSIVLTEKFKSLAVTALGLMTNRRVCSVQKTSEAQEYLDELERFATHQINSSDAEVIRQLWNRAHIKALKLSAILAVGCNIAEPVITLEHAKWAQSFVVTDIWSLLRRFERGEVGRETSETKQLALLARIVREYFLCDPKDLSKVLAYGVTKTLWDGKVLPMMYLQRRLLSHTLFKADRIGATNALQRTIKNFVETDTLREIPSIEMRKKFNTTARAYMLSDMSVIEELKPYKKESAWIDGA